MIPPRELYGGSSQRTSIEVLLMAFTWKSVGALVGAVYHIIINNYNIPQVEHGLQIVSNKSLSDSLLPVSTVSTGSGSEYSP